MKKVFMVKCLEVDSVGAGVVCCVFDNQDSAIRYRDFMQGLNEGEYYFVRDYELYHSFNA